MKRWKSKFERPLKRWNKAANEADAKILQEFGLRRKKEIWKAKAIVRNFRRLAREVVASKDETKEAILLEKLKKLGLLGEKGNVDDVLALTIQDILNRRLQTVVFRKGLAKSMKQSRQMIVHGRIAIGGKRSKWPSSLVAILEEPQINMYKMEVVKNEPAKA
ncbi:MAG TPA: 30S ribosomal protein S4 [archaeon]|nr:30S ribosomal protein S4 [archaeon]